MGVYQLKVVLRKNVNGDLHPVPHVRCAGDQHCAHSLLDHQDHLILFTANLACKHPSHCCRTVLDLGVGRGEWRPRASMPL